MLTVEDALDYLGIDYADEKVITNVSRSLSGAKRNLQSVVGADVFELLPEHESIDILVLAYTQELYDERGTSAKAGNAKREMIRNTEQNLRLELNAERDRRAEEASV